MKCDECDEMAMISVLKDLFGKSDAMRHLCSKHAPPWSMVGGKMADAQGPSPLDVAQARAKALEADRDQISLTLAVAKADRDKWFNRARDLTAELEQAKARVIELSDMKPQTLKQRVQALEAARDKLLSACQDSDDACYGTLSTTFVQHCFAPETAVKPPVQRACTCVIYCSQKDKLASDQYCHADRREAGLAQETSGIEPGSRCTYRHPIDEFCPGCSDS